MKKAMAKRVHPLLSVSGNFGKYGGAHSTHATLIGATHKGPGQQVFFSGVVRAPEAARAAINATTTDLKGKVRRRMNHGWHGGRSGGGRACSVSLSLEFIAELEREVEAARHTRSAVPGLSGPPLRAGAVSLSQRFGGGRRLPVSFLRTSSIAFCVGLSLQP